MPVSFALFWVGVKAKHNSIIRMGLCHLSMIGDGDKRTMIVVCPQRREISQALLEMGGKYRKRTHCWHLPWYKWEQVHQLCVSVFGQEAIRTDARGI